MIRLLCSSWHHAQLNQLPGRRGSQTAWPFEGAQLSLRASPGTLQCQPPTFYTVRPIKEGPFYPHSEFEPVPYFVGPAPTVSHPFVISASPSGHLGPSDSERPVLGRLSLFSTYLPLFHESNWELCMRTARLLQ